jgi:hypothetical protein
MTESHCCGHADCDVFKFRQIYKQVGQKKYREYLSGMAEAMVIWSHVSTMIEDDADWENEGVRLSVCNNAVKIFKLMGMAEKGQNTFRQMMIGMAIEKKHTQEYAHKSCDVLVTVSRGKCGEVEIIVRPFAALLSRLEYLSEICDFDEGFVVKTTDVGNPCLLLLESNRITRI